MKVAVKAGYLSYRGKLYGKGTVTEIPDELGEKVVANSGGDFFVADDAETGAVADQKAGQDESGSQNDGNGNNGGLPEPDYGNVVK